MARSSEQIYQQMLTDMATYPSLAALTSPSETAIFRLLFRVVAYSINLLEQFFDIFKIEVQAIVDAAPFMTDRWLAAQSLLFQDGDNLEADENYRLYYAVVNESLRIVKVASANTDAFGQCLLKIAKGAPGAYEALDASELVRFRAYINDIKPCGTAIDAVSLDADLIKGVFNIYYDSSYILAEVESAVSAVIASFLALQPFNGVMYLSRLVDAIQSAEGVTDVMLEDIECRADLGSYVQVSRKYLPESGYMILDDFNSTFNYIAE